MTSPVSRSLSPCRALQNNLLTGQIPSTIGQLTALSYLYFSCLLFGVALTILQVSDEEFFDRPDSSDAWATKFLLLV